jgi:transglutaminase-like putative cysteine protease
MTTLTIATILDYALPYPHDVLIQIEAAAMTDQHVAASSFCVTSPEPLRAVAGEEGIGQRTWALGTERIRAEYHATVVIDRATPDIALFDAAPPRDLPGLVLPYLLPSRYVESQLFENFIGQKFGALRGGGAVLAMSAWITANVHYCLGTSSGSTTAGSTFVARQGVCRDFAHLMAAFARAANIPARVVSVYAPDVAPQDFHAVVEVWLGDAWQLVDPTGMAQPGDMARIAVGRDATDIAFMTIFGTAELIEQSVSVLRA